MVHLEIGASNGHKLFTTLLRLDASFMIMSHAAFRSRRNSNRVLRPKPENRLLVVLRPKPPNSLEKRIRYTSYTILASVAIILDHPITKSSCTFA